MRSLALSLLLVLSAPALACSEHAEAKKEESKGLDVDGIQCRWNKTAKEGDEKCKPDPSQPTIAQKLDKQLTKDAKTIKKFFGVKGSQDEAQKAEAPKK